MKARQYVLLAIAVFVLAALACGGSSPREAGPTATKAPCAAQTFNGTGDEVLELPDSVRGCTKATLTHMGKSNFIVTPYDADNDMRMLLVNEIGDYDGTVKWDQRATSLEIKADGAWSIRVE